MFLSLFFVNDTQGLCVNAGCFKCTSGVNLSPAIHSIPCILRVNTPETNYHLIVEFYIKVFLILNY